jgi:hypothetical protein
MATSHPSVNGVAAQVTGEQSYSSASVDPLPPATPLKAHLSQMKRIDKHVDHANRVALVNEIIEAFGQ